MSRALPWLLLGGGAAVAAYSWRRTPSASEEAREASACDPWAPAPEPAPASGRWVWPVPMWNGRMPVVSSGFNDKRSGLPRHGGVDIMFARNPSDPYRAGTPNGSPGHVMPDHLIAVAASDGDVWQANPSSIGYEVVIDHGKLVTYYAHLENLFIEPTQRGKSKQHVVAGQPLGFIGASPRDAEHLKHLHFELWAGGPNDKLDPELVIHEWNVVTPSSVRSPSTLVA